MKALLLASALAVMAASAHATPGTSPDPSVPTGIPMVLCGWEKTMDYIFKKDDLHWGERLKKTPCEFTYIKHDIRVVGKKWDRPILALFNGHVTRACVTVYETYAYVGNGERLDFHLAVIRRWREKSSSNPCEALP